MPRTPPGEAARPARGGLPRRPCAAPRCPVGTADPRRVHPRSRRAAGSLARDGRPPRSPTRSPGAACPRPGPIRPRWPATRGTAGTSSSPPRRRRGSRWDTCCPRSPGSLEGGTALYLAPTRALAADQLRVVSELAVPGSPPGRRGRGHAHGGAGLGPLARQLPADHPGHAASDAAAPACPVERVLPPAALHRRGRVPHLPGRVRLARGPGAAQAAPDRRLPRRPGTGRPGIGGHRTDLPARLRHGQRARQLRVPADRAAGRGGDRERGAVRAGHLRPVGAAAHQYPRRGQARRCGAAPPARPPACWPTWWPRRSRCWRSPVPGAAPRPSPWARAGRCASREPPGTASGWRPTGPGTCARTGGRWRRRCATGTSPAWPPPRPWSWAWTSAAWTRCSSRAGPGPGRRSGSRRGGRGGPGAARWSC